MRQVDGWRHSWLEERELRVGCWFFDGDVDDRLAIGDDLAAVTGEHVEHYLNNRFSQAEVVFVAYG